MPLCIHSTTHPLFMASGLVLPLVPSQLREHFYSPHWDGLTDPGSKLMNVSTSPCLCFKGFP